MKALEDWDFDEGTQIVDGYDQCIVGKEYREGKAIYSIELIIEQKMIKDNLSMEEAIEDFDHNIGCAYVGEMTPVFLWQGD